MSNPRVKRPFAGAASDPSQRQITSFFTSRASSADSPATEAIRSSPLPANVECNLLSVGMRVRKSVPEGYKTNTTSAFKLWTDNTPLPTGPRTTSSTTPRETSRELLPFCGINQVGGLDFQPEIREDTDEDDVPALDELPELSMSQESTDSVTSPSNTRKRFFTDDADDDVDPVQTWVSGADSEISPRSLTPTGAGNARAMAVPRSRAAKKAGPSPLKQVVDQENMVIDGDFEEAEFLVYGDGREMDMTG